MNDDTQDHAFFACLADNQNPNMARPDKSAWDMHSTSMQTPCYRILDHMVRSMPIYLRARSMQADRGAAQWHDNTVEQRKQSTRYHGSQVCRLSVLDASTVEQ
jgi:hypothetical protein